MLQINLSTAAAKLLKPHLSTQPSRSPASLQWYAHVLEIKGEQYILAMEWQSRYAMLFYCEDQQMLTDFPLQFKDRLWREACAVSHSEPPLSDIDLDRLGALAVMMGDDQTYVKGHDASVSSHISQVSDLLYNGPMPRSDEACFRFGIKANQMLRKRKQDKDYFKPIEVFRDFWLGLLEQTRAKVHVHRKNVVHVDFSGPK